MRVSQGTNDVVMDGMGSLGRPSKYGYFLFCVLVVILLGRDILFGLKIYVLVHGRSEVFFGD